MGFSVSNNNLFHHSYDEKTRINTYTLDPSKLSEDQIHLLWPISPDKTMLVATALEHFTFPPSHRSLNDKFHFRLVKPETNTDIPLCWCSFPKGFEEVCIRAGKIFDLKAHKQSRNMLLGSSSVRIPAANHILHFLPASTEILPNDKWSWDKQEADNIIFISKRFGNDSID